MKKINNNMASKFALAAFLALGTLTVTTSCNNNKNEIGQEIPDGKAQVIVRVAGINDSNPTVKGKASNSKSSSAEHAVDLVQGNGFDLVTAVSDKIEPNSTVPSGIRASSGSKAASSLPNGFKYRLFLYRNDGGSYTFEQSILLTAGSETPITVTDGATYKWVALSHNNDEDVPDRDGDDNFDLADGTDILYATSESDFTVSGSTVPINVTFNHHLSRIAIEINTKGMFAKPNSATVAVTGLSAHTGTINLLTGDFVGSLTPTTVTLNYASFTDVNAFGDRRVAYVYTANEATQNITVTLSNLKIALDNGAERDFGNTALTKSFSFTPNRGDSHNLLLAPTESALTYGGVQWSRSNLYYSTAINPENPYRFFHLNPASAAASSFFSYGGIKPGVLARQVLPQDPCALVYPAGLWKTPAKADLAALNSDGLTGLLGDLNLNALGSTLDILINGQNLSAANVTGATAGTGYVEFTPTSGSNTAYGAATSASNRLRFNYNGFMRDISLVENLIQLNLGDTGGKYTAFWTNDRSLSLPLGLADLGVTHYLGNLYSGLPPFGTNRGYKGFRSTNILGISALGSVDVIKSSLMNVRCVRDATWAAKSVDPSYNPNPALPN